MEAMQTRHRMDIIVNKRFEVEPFLNALDQCGLLTAKPVESHTPPAGVNRMAQFRRKYILGYWEVTIRCIEDMLPPNAPDIVETSGSHSQMKAMLVPGYIRKDKPEVILSVSTAESTPDLEVGGQSQNGCVALGCAYYLYDARAMDPTSPSRLDVKQRYYACRPPQGIWNALVHAAAQREYGGTKLPVSLETTHGIVAASAGTIPTIFLSPTTDRYTKFNEARMISNNICPVRTKSYRRKLRRVATHGFEVTYQCRLSLGE